MRFPKDIPVFAFIICSLLSGGQSMFAQTEKGDSETLFAGIGRFEIGGDDLRVLFFVMSYGYFFTDRSEVGPLVTLAFVDDNKSESETMVGLGVFYRYNFSQPNRKVMPYISAEVISGDVSEKDAVGGRPGFGFKFFFREHAALDINVGYLVPFTRPDDGFIDTRFGVSFIF